MDGFLFSCCENLGLAGDSAGDSVGDSKPHVHEFAVISSRKNTQSKMKHFVGFIGGTNFIATSSRSILLTSL